MDYNVARIARQTLVDVATPDGSVGCIDSISTRKGVQGAYVTVGNPLCESGWFPLTGLELCGNSARKVVAQYL